MYQDKEFIRPPPPVLIRILHFANFDEAVVVAFGLKLKSLSCRCSNSSFLRDSLP